MDAITVQLADGTEVQVPVENLPDAIPGFVPEASLGEKYVLKTVHNREMANLRKKSEGSRQPQELLEDEEFRATALETWGIPSEDGKALTKEQLQQQVQAELGQQRKKWEREVMAPLTADRDSAKALSASLLNKDLTREILEVANERGVKEYLRKRNPVTGVAPIVSMFRENFGYDQEAGSWHPRGADGSFILGAKGTYKTVGEFFEDLGNDDMYREQLFEDIRQKGPGTKVLGGGGGPAAKSGGVVELDYEQSKNAQAYRAAKAEAEKQGAELRIVNRPGGQGGN